MQTATAASEASGAEKVRPLFEESAKQHASYERYLVQVYEHLGESYQLQGHIFEQALDYSKAAESYTKSLDFYGQCIDRGAHSPDLIVQNDIVGKYCQPNSEATKKSLDNVNQILSGGS